MTLIAFLIQYLFIIRNQIDQKVRKMRNIVFFFLLILATQIPIIHEVIIIGAGVSGIAASKVLTQNSIPHLMIQARNRIGGRIQEGQFQGMKVDFGATFVHQPNKTNPIVDIMRELNWTAKSARFSDEAYYYPKIGIIEDKYRSVANIFQELMTTHIVLKSKLNAEDISIKDAAQGFFKNIMINESQLYQDLLYWLLQSYANVQGGQINELSARQMQYDESPYDMIPTGGYPKLIQAIFKRCHPDLRLNEKVTQIDYRGQIVKITTSKGIHYGRKIISSLPLGILQAKKVQFVPHLPHPYSTSLFHLAPGNQNKLFVSFDKPFWGQKNKWLNFVSKNKVKSKYPVAFVLPAANKHILLFFISGDSNQYVSKLTPNQLKKDILRFLSQFTQEDPKINNIHVTNWHQDQFSLGSYTYYRVGGTRPAIQALRRPLRNKIWFVGEHTHPYLKSLVQGAYLTGMEAAEEIVNQERPRLMMRLFQ